MQRTHRRDKAYCPILFASQLARDRHHAFTSVDYFHAERSATKMHKRRKRKTFRLSSADRKFFFCAFCASSWLCFHLLYLDLQFLSSFRRQTIAFRKRRIGSIPNIFRPTRNSV